MCLCQSPPHDRQGAAQLGEHICGAIIYIREAMEWKVYWKFFVLSEAFISTVAEYTVDGERLGSTPDIASFPGLSMVTRGEAQWWPPL